MRVDGERRLRGGGGAVGGDARFVGENLETADVESRPLVEAAEEYRAHGQHGSREGTGLEDGFRLQRHERAVALDPSLQADDDLRCRHPGLELLPPGHHVAHGSVGGLCQQGSDGLAQRTDLAPKAAPAFDRDHADPVLRQLEHVGHLRARIERPLRARPEGEQPRAVPLGQHGVGLEVALVHHGHPVRLLEDQIGLREALGHISPMEMRLLGDVDRLGRRGLALGDGDTGVSERFAGVGFRPGVGDRRRAHLHRFEGVDGDRQHGVLDVDQIERLLGDGQFVRRHRRHRLPDEDDAIDGEHGVGAGRCLALQLWDVGGGQHRADSRQRPRPAGVDADNTRVGVGAAKELGVQQAARLQIGHILDSPRHLLGSVGPRDRESDSLDFACGLHRRHISETSRRA